MSDEEVIEVEKHISSYYFEIFDMIMQIIEEAEREWELVEKKKELMRIIRELRRMKLITKEEEEEMLDRISEQMETALEVMRRKGVVYEHVAGTLIQIVELKRNAYIGEAILQYLKELEERVKWTNGFEHEKINRLIDEYNATLSALKKVWKLLDIPCKEMTYYMKTTTVFNYTTLQFETKTIVYWYGTLQALKESVRCLRSYVESFINWKKKKSKELLVEVIAGAQ